MDPIIELRPLILSSDRPELVITGLSAGVDHRIVAVARRDRNARTERRVRSDAQGALSLMLDPGPGGHVVIDVSAARGGGALAQLHTFVTSPELAARRPLRCDFHIHTDWSDGRNSVEEMVLRGRELGLDALAITDHNQHGGSVRAAQFAADAGLDLVVFRGEEISASSWHLLAIGASERIGVDGGRNTPEGIYPTIERVHALGGRAFLAHPYWKYNGAHHLVSADYERLLASGKLDGIELFGDVDWSDNMRSLARYLALEPAQRPAIIANSDTHNLHHTFGELYTVVWPKTPGHQDILDAVAERLAVACLMVPGSAEGEREPLPVGPFELVDLAVFLHEHVFPTRNAHAKAEAAAARMHMGGAVE